MTQPFAPDPNWQFWQDSIARQQAEERALSKFTFKPMKGSFSERLRESVEAEKSMPPVVSAPRVPITAEQMKYRLTTAQGVEGELRRRAGLTTPKPATKSAPARQLTNTASPADDISAHAVTIRALHGPESFAKYLQALTQSGQHNAATKALRAVAAPSVPVDCVDDDAACVTDSQNELVAMGLIAPHPFELALVGRSYKNNAQRFAMCLVDDVHAGPGNTRFDLDKWIALEPQFAGEVL